LWGRLLFFAHFFQNELREELIVVFCPIIRLSHPDLAGIEEPNLAAVVSVEFDLHADYFPSPQQFAVVAYLVALHETVADRGYSHQLILSLVVFEELFEVVL